MCSDKVSVRIPVRRNGIATREKIIAAARALMARSDVPMTLRGIAAEAGLSPAAIYQFFASQEDVGRAVEVESVAALEASLAPVLMAQLAAGDPVVFFGRLLAGVMTHQSGHPEALCMARLDPEPGPRGALAEALRTALARQVGAAFARAWPEVPSARREQVLAIAQNAMLGALHGLPPRGMEGRDTFLADVALLVGRYVGEALARAKA